MENIFYSKKRIGVRDKAVLLPKRPLEILHYGLLSYISYGASIGLLLMWSLCTWVSGWRL